MENDCNKIYFVSESLYCRYENVFHKEQNDYWKRDFRPFYKRISLFLHKNIDFTVLLIILWK